MTKATTEKAIPGETTSGTDAAECAARITALLRQEGYVVIPAWRPRHPHELRVTRHKQVRQFAATTVIVTLTVAVAVAVRYLGFDAPWGKPASALLALSAAFIAWRRLTPDFRASVWLAAGDGHDPCWSVRAHGRKDTAETMATARLIRRQLRLRTNTVLPYLGRNAAAAWTRKHGGRH
jgi:hypothetical protein